MKPDNPPENQSAPNDQIPPSGLKGDNNRANWRKKNAKPWLLADTDSGNNLRSEEDEE